MSPEPTQAARDLANALGSSCVPSDIWCLRHKAFVGADSMCPIARADVTTIDAALDKARQEGRDEILRPLLAAHTRNTARKRVNERFRAP